MELKDVIDTLVELSEMPVFRRNGGKEYDALMYAIGVLSEGLGDSMCEYYTEKETQFPNFANGVLEMRKVTQGSCFCKNDFCSCKGDKSACELKRS